MHIKLFDSIREDIVRDVTTADTARKKTAEETQAEYYAHTRILPQKQPCCQAVIIERKRLSGPGSTKATYHLSLETDLPHSPGDSIAIYPRNQKEDVERILAKVKGKSVIHPKLDIEVATRDYLFCCANLERVTTPLLRAAGIDDKADHDVVSLVEMSDGIEAQALVDSLAPLLPRFYSIASATPGKIDLLIATFAYEKGGRKKGGVGSDYLCQTAPLGTCLPAYISTNDTFVPPAGDVPMIMIGPGTGIAPYRAFMHVRPKTSDNWLFFGERNAANDFYYEEEWPRYNHLRVTTAFSRDQTKKVYVQDRLLEHGAEIYAWLKRGAHIFVCGDAKRMAKDVAMAFHTLLMEHGNLSSDDAHAELRSLRKNKRYLMDVY